VIATGNAVHSPPDANQTVFFNDKFHCDVSIALVEKTRWKIDEIGWHSNNQSATLRFKASFIDHRSTLSCGIARHSRRSRTAQGKQEGKNGQSHDAHLSLASLNALVIG
jgi:hypothetical protein